MPRTLLRDEAQQRASIVSNLRYTIMLDLTAGEERFGCTTTVRFDCSQPGASTFLDFICDRVASITLNGEDLPAASADGARVALEGLRAQNEVTIVAEPRYEHTGVGLHRFVDPVDGKVYLHTQFESYNARRVFPCFDQPDLKGTFELSVRAPAEWQVSSNMTAEVFAEGDAKMWRFAVTPVMSTYITAVVAGPYHIVTDRHRSIDLGLWCRQSLVEYLEPDEMFEITKQGFDFFEKLFDYPYPFGKYDQLFVPEFNAGAMENAGCVTFSEAYVFRSKVTQARRERRAATILHEMAHMWFGDLVTMKWWDDLWLNESFAEYAALVAQVKATRFKNGFVTFADSEKTWAYRQDQLPTTHPVAADCPDVETAEVNFDGISYAKGASVLRQLVAWVGEENFYRGLRGYFRRYEFSNADLAGFLASLEEGSGRDLQAWSREWLQTPGVNTLRAEAVVEGDVFSSFTVVQDAPAVYPLLRSHRIAIGLYDAGPDGVSRRRRVEIDIAGERSEVKELTGERVPDLVLLNDDDLTFAKTRFDARSLETIEARLRDVGDPLARSLCWTMCWDMVRDAELSATEWARIVYANVDGEQDIGVLRSLLDRTRNAIMVYGDPAKREQALQRFATLARERIAQQSPGSDEQLVWVQAFASAARSPEDVAFVRALLDGTEQVEGLSVDTDLRWHLVRCLAGIGAVGEAEIAAEHERDKTDQGERYAASARASMPSVEAKEQAWTRIVDDERLPFAMMRALMEGFHWHEQQTLLRPYLERYLDRLVPLYRSRDLPVAMEFAEDMFPHTLVAEETAQTIERFVEATDVPAPVKRFVLEGLDSLRRAVRGRARDAQA